MPGLLGQAAESLLRCVSQEGFMDTKVLLPTEKSFYFSVSCLLYYLRWSFTSGFSPQPTQYTLSFHTGRTYQIRQ